MSNSKKFNSAIDTMNAAVFSEVGYEIRQRLMNPESKEQVEKDFKKLSRLPKDVKQNALDAFVNSAMEQAKTLMEPAGREALAEAAASLKSAKPGSPEVRAFLRRVQLDAYVLARVMKEKDGALPPLLDKYAKKLAALSDTEFSDPYKHLDTFMSVFGGKEKPVKNPFKNLKKAGPRNP